MFYMYKLYIYYKANKIFLLSSLSKEGGTFVAVKLNFVSVIYCLINFCNTHQMSLVFFYLEIPIQKFEWIE